MRGQFTLYVFSGSHPPKTGATYSGGVGLAALPLANRPPSYTMLGAREEVDPHPMRRSLGRRDPLDAIKPPPNAPKIYLNDASASTATQGKGRLLYQAEPRPESHPGRLSS